VTSSPTRYVPRTLVDIDAMQFNAYDGTTDVEDWMGSLTPEDCEIYRGPLGNMLYVANGGYNMTIEDGQYVYVDEDGFHVINKGTFETLYREAPPV
jgi:hypothetical protein